MSQLLKVGSVVAAIGTASLLSVGCSNATNTTEKSAQTTEEQSTDSSAIDSNMNVGAENDMSTTSTQTSDGINTEVTDSTMGSKDISPVTNGVSQQITGDSNTANSLNKLLPKIKYSTTKLSETAKKVNEATWKVDGKMDRNVGTKVQALLSWNHSGVGAVDGHWGKNTRKAMQAFQKAQGLPVTESLDERTWQALTKNSTLTSQPVLVSYQLTDADVSVKTTRIPASAEAKAELEGMYYESVL